MDDARLVIGGRASVPALADEDDEPLVAVRDARYAFADQWEAGRLALAGEGPLFDGLEGGPEDAGAGGDDEVGFVARLVGECEVRFDGMGGGRRAEVALDEGGVGVELLDAADDAALGGDGGGGGDECAGRGEGSEGWDGDWEEVFLCRAVDVSELSGCGCFGRWGLV